MGSLSLTLLQTLTHRRLRRLRVALRLEAVARPRPVVGERLHAQPPARGRGRLMTAVLLGRVHADLIDQRRPVGSAGGVRR